MYIAKTLLVFLIAIYTQSDAAKTLPDFVTPCKLKTSDISKCYKENIENLRPHLLKGIRELQVQAIDPLKVSEVVVSQNDSAAVSYRTEFKNLLLEGGKDFKIEKLDIDVQKPSFKVTVGIPKVSMKGGFTVSGSLLGFSLNGPGSAVIDFNDVVIKYSCEGEMVSKKDGTFIDWKDGKSDMVYDSNISLQIDGIFTDSSQLKLFNEALKENAKGLAPHLDPVLKNSFTAYITESLRRVHKIFSVDVLYPGK